MDHALPALVCALLAGAVSVLVPRLIAWVPEPEPDPEQPDQESTRQKEPYVDVAALPGLAGRSAVAGAVAGGVIGATVGWAWPLLFLVPFVPLGVALAVIDWRTRLLPTRLIAPAYPVVVGLVVVAGVASRDWHDLRRAGFGWLVIGGYYVLMWVISPRLMGYGDVRLSGLLGLMLGYLGWAEIVLGLFLPFFFLGVPSLLVTLVRRRKPVPRPFGPAMLVAAAVVVAIGPAVGQWYAVRTGL